jgi:DNA-binding beta-propeller fold protein YncE
MLTLALIAAFLVTAARTDPPVDAPTAAGRGVPSASCTLVRSIQLPGVSGRIDHLAHDPVNRRLFVAALGNGSIEVIDLEKGERAASIHGLSEPQGIAYVPATRRVVVACGGDGTVHAYDAASLSRESSVHVGEDADNVHLEGRGRGEPDAVLVAHSSGEVTRLDPATLKPGASFKLPGHPEGFAVDPEASRIYVNVPGGFVGGGGSVHVIDTAGSAPPTVWPLKDAGRNFPIALDAPHKRLFVGCRRPARLLVLDTTDGHVLCSPACVGDADDIFVDDPADRVMVIGGDGTVEFFSTNDHAAYVRSEVVTTAPGARTGLFVPSLRALFVAVPAHAGVPAEIREYSVALQAVGAPGAR